ncbi:MAG: hypothetical protein LBQ59_02120 [Candidatus Peribacteria bacterium]|jgi:hypothetical protein|nr:hypothetical protein [Candidatus Peribacteria bacterium]
MSDNSELINEFMLTENKKALGEDVEKTSISGEGNSLSDTKNILNRFSTNDSATSKDADKAYLLMRKFLNFIVVVPILIAGVFSFFYIIMKLCPLFLSFIRGVFIGLWMK